MIDTHAHLNDPELYADVDNIVKDSKQNGLDKIICASFDLPSSILACQIANQYDDVFCTVGMHPHDSKDYDDNMEKQFETLCKTNKKVVAFGEIGLDYHYDLSPRETQKQIFERQIILAHKLKLPIVIHTREAIGDTLSILQNNKQYLEYGVVFHCFNASKEVAKILLDQNFKFSFGGSVTFKNSNIGELIKYIPTQSFFLETDCPYLAPVPLRGQINVPKNVNLVAQKIAEILQTDKKQIENICDQNAKNFFNFEKNILK